MILLAPTIKKVAHYGTHRLDDVILLARLDRERYCITVSMTSLSLHALTKKVARHVTHR
jgi:hypothetical protein